MDAFLAILRHALSRGRIIPCSGRDRRGSSPGSHGRLADFLGLSPQRDAHAPYQPRPPEQVPFMERAQTQERSALRVTTADLTPDEIRFFSWGG